MRRSLHINIALALWGLLGCWPAAHAAFAADGGEGIVESTTDLFGLYQQKQHAKSYAVLAARGLRVLNLPAEERYAAVWKPDGYASGRILVLLHGTAGAAYDGMKDELEMAEAYDLMLVGIQWHDARTNTYDPPEAVYQRIDTVLRYLHHTDGVPLTKAALSGFSRGAAISYEVAYRDLHAHHYFALTIAHSGGIPKDGVIARGESNNPGVFYTNLTTGALGPAPFAGAHFFLYAGEQDEQWGAKMAENVLNAKALITRNGGEVVECIIDPQGTHMGYLRNPDYHQRSMKAFMTLIGEDTAPVRAVSLTTGGSSEQPRPPRRRAGPPPHPRYPRPPDQ